MTNIVHALRVLLSPVPSLFVVMDTLEAGTTASRGFGSDCEALSSNASPATGGRRFEGGRTLVASTMAAASPGVTGDSEVRAVIIVGLNTVAFLLV